MHSSADRYVNCVDQENVHGGERDNVKPFDVPFVRLWRIRPGLRRMPGFVLRVITGGGSGCSRFDQGPIEPRHRSEHRLRPRARGHIAICLAMCKCNKRQKYLLF